MNPVLLTNPDYLGSLAALRWYGRHGTPVTVAHPDPENVGTKSRFVSRFERSPAQQQPEQLLEWLRTFGEAHPGHVLPATSDNTAFLFALHRDELAQWFRMYQPPVESIYRLLNKVTLTELCHELGIETPTHVVLRNGYRPEDPVPFGFPVLVKPQTQILKSGGRKGGRVDSPEALAEMLRHGDPFGYHPVLREHDPSVVDPLLQQYLDEAATGIVSLSGFIDEQGRILGARSAVKVLQWPRKLGLGLCFEARPVSAELLEQCRRLLVEAAYHGPFEVEFIETRGRHLLIDANPRYYGQMGFDIARGLPLPGMLHAAATGDHDRLEALTNEAAGVDDTGYAYSNSPLLTTMLRALTVSGRMPRVERRHWRRWRSEHVDAGRLVEAVLDTDDPGPGRFDSRQRHLTYLRHPRDFVRSILLDR